MNCTRLNIVPAGRRHTLSVMLAIAVMTFAATTASAGNPADSPYYGDPILSVDSPLALDGHGGRHGSDSFNAPTLRVGGLERNSADLDEYFQVPGGGHGIMGRIGHVAGKTVGRSGSLTHINLQPYVFIEQNMFFGDFRMYRLNKGGRQGGNIGGGWRRYFADHDAILGAIGYFDVDATRSKEFQQMGLSLELLSRWIDVRANWYIPFGDTEQILGTNFINGSQRFEGYQLLVDTVTSFANAGEGVDLTFTSPVPWKKLQPYNAEMSAGFYNFQARNTKLPQLWGYRLRADASFFDRVLHTFVELTNDRQHETSVVFGASLDYYGGFESRSRVCDRQYYRMSEWVRRNYNVVTIESDVVNTGVPVINPWDNEPYIFVHIENNPPGPVPRNGTVEFPLDDINDAFANAPTVIDPATGMDVPVDVYLVHGGSTFTGTDATLVVPDGKILLGENVGTTVGNPAQPQPQTLPAVLGRGVRDVILPAVRATAGPVTLLNSAGPAAIDATSARIVGGFTITDPTGDGLLVSGRSNNDPDPFNPTADQLFRDLLIQGADGDGVHFEDAQNARAGGQFSLQRVRVVANDNTNGGSGNGAMGIAFHVEGGTATIQDITPITDTEVNARPTFQNSGGNLNSVVLVEGTLGGTVDLGNSTINDDGGGGIRLFNNVGNVTIGEALITNTMVVPGGVGAGVEIFGSTGLTTLGRSITVDNASGVGFFVHDLPLLGEVSVASAGTGSTAIAVNNRQDIGANFNAIAGRVRFFPTTSLNIGTLNTAVATDQPAIRFSDSTGDVILNDVFVADSLSDGILVGGDPNAPPLIGGAEDPLRRAGPNIATINPGTGAIIDRPQFLVTGTAQISNTGQLALLTPSQLGTAGIRIQGPTLDPAASMFGEESDVDFRDTVNIDLRADRGIAIANTSGDINFSDQTLVQNDLGAGSERAALQARSSIGSIVFNTFIADTPIAGEPAVEIREIPFPGGVGFDDLQIIGAIGDGMDMVAGDGDPTVGLPADTTGLLVLNVNDFTVNTGSITVQNGIAVDIENVFAQDNTGFQTLMPGQRILRDNMFRPVVVVENAMGEDEAVAVLNPLTGNPANPQPVPLPTGPFTELPAYNVSFIDVSSTATAAGMAPIHGIVLINDVGQFEILGTAARSSGGTISDTTISGLFADNADYVSINYQDYTANQVGLEFHNMNDDMDDNQGFVLNNVQVMESVNEAVIAENIRNIRIDSSVFTDNGAPGFDTIDIFVNQLPGNPFDPNDYNPATDAYIYTITNNEFTDLADFFVVPAHGVSISTANVGVVTGSRVDLTFSGNTFVSFARDNSSLLFMDWDGIINATITNNLANIGPIAPANVLLNPTGFDINQQSGDDTSQILLSNNQLTTPAAVGNVTFVSNMVGANFDFAGTAFIDVNSNTFDLGTGAGTTGLNFRLRGANSVVNASFNTLRFNGSNNVFTNTFTGAQFRTPAGTGINVAQVFAPATFIFNGNDIDFANIGFNFASILGGAVNLNGNVSNMVTNVHATFSPLPANPLLIQGQFIINGVPGP